MRTALFDDIWIWDSLEEAEARASARIFSRVAKEDYLTRRAGDAALAAAGVGSVLPITGW